MGIGTKRFVIRRKSLLGNGLMWKDGIDGVYPHPVNERLFRSIKSTWPAKDWELLGSWEDWEDFRDGKTKVEPVKEPEKVEPVKAEQHEPIEEPSTDLNSLNMAELREMADGKVDPETLAGFKGRKGKSELVKLLANL